MKLYYAQTANCYKTCAVAKHLELPIEFIEVNLGKGEHKTPEFLKKNPNGKVPVLETEQGTLWESSAIMCYLARQAQSELCQSELWPDDERQVEILRWQSWDFDRFLPTAGVYYYQNIIKPTFGIGEPSQEALNKAEDQFLESAQILDDHLSGREFIVGDSLSLADFSLAVLLPYAEQAKIPLNGFNEIQRWHNNLMQLPAWQNPFPQHQK